MDGIGIEIERQYQNFVFLSANNGVFSGGINLFLDKSHLKKIGKALVHLVNEMFNKNPNEFSYSIGSNPPDDKSDYLTLRVNQGVLHVLMITKTGECSFSIYAEPWGIHRLGELIRNFSDEKYRLLKWSPNANKDVLVESESRKQDRPKQKKPKLPKTKDNKNGWKSGLKAFIESIESKDFLDYR